MYVNCLLYTTTYVHALVVPAVAKSAIMPSKTRDKTRENRLTACELFARDLKQKNVKMSTSRYTDVQLSIDV